MSRVGGDPQVSFTERSDGLCTQSIHGGEQRGLLGGSVVVVGGGQRWMVTCSGLRGLDMVVLDAVV